VKPEPWENDNATKACREWVRAWRETVGPDASLPSLTFAALLGREAMAMQAEEVPLRDMLRVFSAAGRDGSAPSGRRADGRPA
jgi:hypothetical protein